VITDTSCLILLDKINAFDVLNRLFKYVSTTPEIKEEFGVNLPEWVEIRLVQDVVLMEAFKDSVDLGEASAISLAIETPNSLIIVDDLKARKLASRMELKFIGTLGLFLMAKKHNVISNVRPYINKIQATDFRISQDLINYTLKKADEN
jgi:predicted nucleic acid-binding protein